MQSQPISFSLSDVQFQDVEQENRLKAEHFTAQGELRLLHDDPAGIDLFEAACRLDSDNADLLYRQGLALFEYGSEEGREKNWRLAGQKFKASTRLNPESLRAWQAWGDLLRCQAVATKQHHFFLQARDKFEKALSLLSQEQTPPESASEIHGHLGFVFLHLAKSSGEACDYQKAIDYFQKAAAESQTFPEEFWISFGEACRSLGACINDVRLIIRSLHCFKHAVSLSVSCFQAWRSMAETLHTLYEKTHDDDHFAQANDCFAAAAQLRPDLASIWLEWSLFLCEAGRRLQDVKRLRLALEKCEKAAACDRNNPQILAAWGEILALIGELTERIDLLHEAYNKVAEASTASPDDPRVWHAYGLCLQSFGHYFQDSDYYYQAIEKCQLGLSIDRTNHRLWYTIACTYLMVGTIEQEVESLQRACRFFQRAINLNPGNSTYIFDYALALSKLGEINQVPQLLEQAIVYFEKALGMQKNAVYLHPEWLFYYACTLDLLGDSQEEPSLYSRAIEVFSHVLTIDPDFPMIHQRLGMAFSHLGELTNELEYFQRALHCMRLASRKDEDNEQILLDWGIVLINISQYTNDAAEADLSLREAEAKITQAAKLGNLQAYYQLAGLHSLLGNHERAMRFIDKAEEYDALPPLDDLIQDEWLEGLRTVPAFRELISRLEQSRVSEKDISDDR